MKRKCKKLWLWLPRVLMVLLILFVSMFALDSFEEEQWLLALLMHLVPSYVLVGLAVWAWKKPKWAGVAMIVVGLLVMVVFFSWLALPVIVPVWVVGGLFVVSGMMEKK